jgi:hypothetical protein
MENLLAFCQKWPKEHGYAVAKAHSNANKNFYIRCDHSGKYCGSLLKLPDCKTATAKIMCPFEIKGLIPTSKKLTNKVWNLEIQNGEHNHGPSARPSSHLAHKRLLPEQFEEIKKLLQSNLKPTQILLQLQTTNNKTYATNKTFSNALQRIHRNDLAGRTPIKALLCVLKESNWSYNVAVNKNGLITNLFFAHPGSIHLACINHHVALLDLTCKTNRYQLPLLHVIGQAASNCSFLIAFCFLACEDAESYLRAINNLKKHIWRPQHIPKVLITNRHAALRSTLAEVFPGSQANLCTWHLKKNITTQCKKYFAHHPKKNCLASERKQSDPWNDFMSLWGQVTHAKTHNIY